jgi:hypothetical protein
MLTAEAVPRKVRKGPIFGCFEVKSMTTAQFIREGTDLELAAYVQRLPQTRLILVERKNGVWTASNVAAFSVAAIFLFFVPLVVRAIVIILLIKKL